MTALMQCQLFSCTSSCYQQLQTTAIQKGLEHGLCFIPAGDLSGLQHFESHLATFREHLELEVGKLVTNAQQLTDDNNWWTNTDQVGLPPQQCAVRCFLEPNHGLMVSSAMCSCRLWVVSLVLSPTALLDPDFCTTVGMPVQVR